MKRFFRMLFMLLMVTFTAMSFSSCSSDDDEDEPASGNEQQGLVAVDLGLSVKWASCNLGATKLEEPGDYYIWGVTSPYPNVKESPYIGKTREELQSLGVVDANGNLTKKYDAASQSLGGTWRMPTVNEFEELEKKCDFVFVNINGVNCQKIIGPNGNYIIIPITGTLDGYDYGRYVFCWSSSMYLYNSSSDAIYLYGFGEDNGLDTGLFFDLFLIRAVCK